MSTFLRIAGLLIVIFGVGGGVFLITGKYGGNTGMYGFSVIITSAIIGVLYYVLGYFTKLSQSIDDKLMDIYGLLSRQQEKVKKEELRFAPEEGIAPIKKGKKIKEEVVGAEEEPQVAKRISRVRKETGLCANCWLSGECEREKKARKRKEIITSCPGYLPR